jgi:WD40 repeat protein
MQEWSTSTWKQIKNSNWSNSAGSIDVLAVNSTGTLVAYAPHSKRVHICRCSDGQTIAIFKHSDIVKCVVFSTDGKHIFSGCDNKISQYLRMFCSRILQKYVLVHSGAVISHLAQGCVARQI